MNKIWLFVFGLAFLIFGINLLGYSLTIIINKKKEKQNIRDAEYEDVTEKHIDITA